MNVINSRKNKMMQIYILKLLKIINLVNQIYKFLMTLKKIVLFKMVFFKLLQPIVKIKQKIIPKRIYKLMKLLLAWNIWFLNFKLKINKKSRILKKVYIQELKNFVKIMIAFRKVFKNQIINILKL